MKKIKKFNFLNKKILVKIFGTSDENHIYNFLYRDKFFYIQIYDKDNILLWNKKLEWTGVGFIERN